MRLMSYAEYVIREILYRRRQPRGVGFNFRYQGTCARLQNHPIMVFKDLVNAGLRQGGVELARPEGINLEHFMRAVAFDQCHFSALARGISPSREGTIGGAQLERRGVNVECLGRLCAAVTPFD